MLSPVWELKDSLLFWLNSFILRPGRSPVIADVESYLIGRSGSETLHRFKGEWSPKIAKDLYCLLSEKRIK